MRSKKLWGGRFGKGTAEAVDRFTESLSVDRRLAEADLAGSIAHIRMLKRQRIVPAKTADRILKGLTALLIQAKNGRFRPDPKAEDIHTAIQWALHRKIGAAAEYLHAGRSRNDQVVTALRIVCRESVGSLAAQIRQLQKGLLAQARKSAGLIMPGYTHMRHAQPVAVSHLFLSYLPALERDRQRLIDAGERLNELPLGSGALTGSTLPLNRKQVARELKFQRVMENSVDGVTTRDFVLEIGSGLTALGVTLSRIAEDWILWSTDEYGFLSFDESLLTGSSMMPQKQNPDFLELTRGSAARLLAAQTGIAALTKGLPSGYQRDLQLDKTFLFDALEAAEGMLTVVTLGAGALRWDRMNLARQLSDESLYATDLAEYLVMRKVPFAEAHRIVGRLLRETDRSERPLADWSLADYRKFSSAFDRQVHDLFDPAGSIGRKQSAGSTAPAEIRRMIRVWSARLR
ncbi:MAG: argininosuccinate lyase [Candidatus Omnitrophica bacterium CG11_big_fil_rev_8_21_14_0_20_64_10]|nr:MAG: argininosuccinate lyase [Candidatus Omnitrophica bacterium CG11_big_fil_rev_8_21_14_0_20_64_10]